MLEEILAGDFLLYLIPLDGHLLYIEHAVAIAELLPVTDLRGYSAERVVRKQHTAGFFQLALPVQEHALRDGSVHGTALQRAFGLFTK